MNLWELKLNESAVIDAIPTNTDSSRLSTSLKELGLKKDAVIKCLHKSIFGGPRVYQIGGIMCTLCKQGAVEILIHQA